MAQVSELYQREVLEWDVVQRGLYRSFTGIFRTPVCDTVLPSWSWRRLFLGPGFRLAARWNRLGETVKMRKKRGEMGKKWARYV